jgi:hypothetical protein
MMLEPDLERVVLGAVGLFGGVIAGSPEFFV